MRRQMPNAFGVITESYGPTRGVNLMAIDELALD